MELYLVTGFLGAGKTTLIGNLLTQFSPRRCAVLVNEFGREDVDGALLREREIALREVHDGSIFCACRIGQFEDSLIDLMSMNPEIILVEASGLSDPCNIESILQQKDFQEITYRGSICLADATRFERILDAVAVCRKQVGISRLVLVNKVDLAGEAQTEHVIALIRSLYPDALVRPTVNAQMELSWLDDLSAQGDRAPRGQSKQVGLQKKLMVLREPITRAQLLGLLGMLGEDTYRIKGIVRCEGVLVLAQSVSGQVTLTPIASGNAHINHLNLLAGPGMPLRKAITRAIEWYPELIVEVI